MSRPILVVDDDESILATIAELLDMEGYQVQTAVNGVDALNRLDTSDPSLVLLDMRMPVMDGWGFARALHARGRRVPILVMTAAQDAQAWADEVGAAGFVAKPFDLPDLLHAIEHLTG
jgi:CheY-like chemotaxis protein